MIIDINSKKITGEKRLSNLFINANFGNLSVNCTFKLCGKKLLLIRGCYRELIFFVILDTFLEAFCLLMIPVFAIDINSEFNLGRKAKASFLSFFSINKFIFFKAFLKRLFLDLLTAVCLFIFLVRLIADLVFAISVSVYLQIMIGSIQ